MTDRLNGVTVVFEKPIRDDDAEYLINAIRMLKHVVRVEPIIRTGDSELEQIRIKSEIRDKLYAFMKDNL